MTGVLGRWGNGTELRLALDIIRVLYAQAGKLRGDSAIVLHNGGNGRKPRRSLRSGKGVIQAIGDFRVHGEPRAPAY